MYAFNVWKENKIIDTVFYDIGKQTIKDALENVHRSLVSHDGYSQDIRVTWPKGQKVNRKKLERK